MTYQLLQKCSYKTAGVASPDDRAEVPKVAIALTSQCAWLQWCVCPQGVSPVIDNRWSMAESGGQDLVVDWPGHQRESHTTSMLGLCAAPGPIFDEKRPPQYSLHGHVQPPSVLYYCSSLQPLGRFLSGFSIQEYCDIIVKDTYRLIHMFWLHGRSAVLMLLASVVTCHF